MKECLISSVYKISFPTNGSSRIIVYNKENEFLSVERKFYFGSKIVGEFFQQERKIAIVSTLAFSIKIIFQEFTHTLKVCSNNLFYSIFKINNEEIRIVQNPLYFIFPKFYSKIYWKDELVGIVSMEKILDFNGITLNVRFSTNNYEIQYYSIISFLITCLNTNI